MPEAYGVWIVIAEQGQAGLVGALQAEAERTSRGFSPSRSHSNAFQWLCDRAAELPPEVLRRAKRASEALERAQQAYAEATHPIRVALGYAPPSTTVAPASLPKESNAGSDDSDPADETAEPLPSQLDKEGWTA